RLHADAIDITRKHDGQVPDNVEELRSLPGVGEYTATAIASFAFHQAHVVLDITVGRLFARAVCGQGNPSADVSAAARDRRAGLHFAQSGMSRVSDIRRLRVASRRLP